MSIVHAQTGPLGELFFEEPEVARFIPLPGRPVVSSSRTRRDKPTGTFSRFRHPASSAVRRPVIFFRTRHTKLPRISVRLNSTPLTQFTFTVADPPERSWHEIIPAGALKLQGNELVFSVSGQGTVIFGDVVILYTSNELTVRKPLVLTPG